MQSSAVIKASGRHQSCQDPKERSSQASGCSQRLPWNESTAGGHLVLAGWGLKKDPYCRAQSPRERHPAQSAGAGPRSTGMAVQEAIETARCKQMLSGPGRTRGKIVKPRMASRGPPEATLSSIP